MPAPRGAIRGSPIMNQFAEMANYRWHYHVTGVAAAAEAVETLGAGRPAAFVSAMGSAGTIAAGDALKARFGTRIVGLEPVQCPTLSCNGYGGHAIEGIGDKHVTWIHHVTNLDAMMCIDDEECLLGLQLVSEPAGRDFLAAGGGLGEAAHRLSTLLGVSGVCNILGAIKTAKWLRLGKDDAVVTVATDGLDRYPSVLRRLAARTGPLTRGPGRGAPGVDLPRPEAGLDLGRDAREPRAVAQPEVLHVGRAAGKDRGRARRAALRELVGRPGRARRRRGPPASRGARLVTGPAAGEAGAGGLAITGGTVVTLDPPAVERRDVLLGAEPRRSLDASGCLVMPGLVIAHTHLYAALARGMPAPPEPPRSFREILERVWWRLDAALDESSLRGLGGRGSPRRGSLGRHGGHRPPRVPVLHRGLPRRPRAGGAVGRCDGRALLRGDGPARPERRGGGPRRVRTRDPGRSSRDGGPSRRLHGLGRDASGSRGPGAAKRRLAPRARRRGPLRRGLLRAPRPRRRHRAEGDPRARRPPVGPRAQAGGGSRCLDRPQPAQQPPERRRVRGPEDARLARRSSARTAWTATSSRRRASRTCARGRRTGLRAASTPSPFLRTASAWPISRSETGRETGSSSTTTRPRL